MVVHRFMCVLFAGVLCTMLVGGCASEGSSSAVGGESAPPASESTAGDTLDRRAQNLLVEGQWAFQQGNYEGAMVLLDSAESFAPGAPVIPFNRGRVYTALNRIDDARRSFSEAIERDPLYPEARFRLGDIELQLGNLEAALDYYRQEESIEPSSELFVQMGEAYYRLGQADSARGAYERAIAADDSNATAHMMYGQLLEEMGRLDEALRHSRQALAAEPTRSNYQFAVGSQLYQMGQLEESVEYLRSAADARLLHYPAQYNLAQVLLRLGREEEAAYYQGRADSSRRLMDRITAAQSTAAQNQDSVSDWIELGELFRVAGERDRAVQAFNRAASLEPNNLRIQRNVGEMMLAEGEIEGAILRFQAIIQADRTRIDVWKNLALAHAAAGQCADARRAVNVAIELQPDDPSLPGLLDGVCRVES